MLLPSSTADGAHPPTDPPNLELAQRDALAAPVADPLWLLARQWQTGEFVAIDGGSPVRADLSWSHGPLTRPPGDAITGPWEPSIEAENLPGLAELDQRSRVRMATELRRTLRDTALTASQQDALWSTWRTSFPFADPVGDTPVSLVAARLPDPAALLTSVLPFLRRPGGPFPPLPGMADLDPSTVTSVQAALWQWFGWAQGFFAVRPADRAPAAWDQSRQAYQLQVGAGSLILNATEYDGSGLDWFSFDKSAVTPQPGPVTTEARAMLPTPVSYAGMPRPRWWELEDGDVNLDALRSSADPAHAVLAAFAHSFSNDWFLCPLELPPGWAQITSLAVTDTFGTVVQVESVAALDEDTGPWRMWDLARADGPADASAGLRLCWPISPPRLEGPVLEEILLAKDELANLAWIVELQTQDPGGRTVDRFRRWQELRPDHTAAVEAMGYRLGTAVPDFWYALATVGEHGSQQFRRASLPPEASGVSDVGVQGIIVAHDTTAALAVSAISRQGSRVLRRDCLILGPAGLRVWRARLAQLGTGEASSGLRFDLVD